MQERQELAAPGSARELQQQVRLTQYAKASGCAAKLGPGALAEILERIPRFEHPDLLIGTGVPDDAGVYRLRPDLALVQTVDFFTPVVNDPYTFGQIAAANALSDVYAMGGTPLTALNLVAFPICTLGAAVLEEILRGGGDKVAEAGAVILGGHSIEDSEPKYGLAVTGIVHPDRIATNQGAQPGDRLVLTKPIGTGVLATALKGGLLDADAERRLGEAMSALNAGAARAMLQVGVHACTDITGFGLLGHLRELAFNSGVDLEIEAPSVPYLPQARKLAGQGIIPAGTYRNRDHVAPYVDIAVTVTPAEQDLLCDPQTSGGLLMAVPEAKKEELLAALSHEGVGRVSVIGRVTGCGTGRIVVRGL
jgi:selenide,water dikinase